MVLNIFTAAQSFRRYRAGPRLAYGSVAAPHPLSQLQGPARAVTKP